MTQSAAASFQLVRTPVRHLVRTAMVRDDLVGWVVCGRKRLATPRGDITFAAGQAFILPRATQWDLLNEPVPGGHYEARLIAFAPQTVQRFHDRFGQFAATPALQGCASADADDAFVSTFSHASAALLEPEVSDAVREHRALEVLLLLAERGVVFAPMQELGWADRVHRLVSQRPHAAWTVETLAQAFHLSASSLQRRLSEEGTSASRCVRDVRLESAMALLQGTNLQVSEIAARCGYDSHSRFTAAFRKRFGYAPSHLRP
ncbi:helix-turn-helix transcriptional regulator [Ideonella sp. BN130291]|uniref:helix-turn-helix transcriptional regulator n=1 Tax=Ideonella sp. BN130291 TaxID=3112940 RepID=UPI002E2644B9|nr:helix-turn-helix transcriptional regulator [Ideonella sp. BN130291]